MQDVADIQSVFQQATAAAGAQANANFIGETLANGANSTGNNFIAPNYKTPYSIQMNIGIQQELRRVWCLLRISCGTSACITAGI
jgi:hypothetical protein